ncbi:MAG: hypothetical protein PVF54_08185, partial [Anaerolineae bacterium]
MRQRYVRMGLTRAFISGDVPAAGLPVTCLVGMLLVASRCGYAAPGAEMSYRAIYEKEVEFLKPGRTDRFNENTDGMYVGWANSYRIHPIMWLYKATGQRRWLDLMTWWGDGYFSRLTMDSRDHPDGPGWRTTWRAGAYVHSSAAKDNRTRATIEPAEQRIKGENGGDIRDTTYTLSVSGPGKLECQVSSGAVREYEFASGEPFELVEGVQLTIKGTPAKGDEFLVKMSAPRNRSFMVCEGRGITPFCLFIEEVMRDPELEKLYGEKARHYLKLIEQIAAKYDTDWVDLEAMPQNPYNRRGGVYRLRNDKGELGLTAPHNQYGAMAEGMAILYRVTKKPYYRERVEKLATYMKSCMWLEDDCYQWHYLSQSGPWDADDRPWVEDTGYAAMDVGFVLAAHESGIVFTEQDMQRFANTFLDKVWN